MFIFSDIDGHKFDFSVKYFSVKGRALYIGRPCL